MKNYCNPTIAGVLCACVLMACVPFGTGLGQERARASQGWAKYQIIMERNIFSRQRGPRRQAEENRERPPVVVPNPESYLRLRGIAQEDGVFVAFVEDTQVGTVLQLRAGDSVARGAVKSLTLDTIEYEFQGQAMTIQIGQDLEGGQGAVTTSELLEWSDTAVPTGDPTGAGAEQAPTEAEAELIRQLMERRKQQGG